MEVSGRLSYANQEAWVFSGTLRENILFGQPYESHWYNFVVEACALDTVSGCDLQGRVGLKLLVFWYLNSGLRHGFSHHSRIKQLLPVDFLML